MKRRDAQAVCPSLDLYEYDQDAAMRSFQEVLSVVDGFVPRVEVIEPGSCLFPTLGPARYHGGEESLAGQLARAVAAVLDVAAEHLPPVGVGVADGPRLALLAAHEAIRGHRRERGTGQGRATCPAPEPLIVAPGTGAEFLGPLPIGRLTPVAGSETVALLRRLGLGDVGAFAALEARDVLARLGNRALDAHRLANGHDDRVPDPAQPRAPVLAERVLEPPVERIDQAAFMARAMAEDLIGSLTGRGLIADGILVVVEMETGDRSERIWRTDRGFSAATITQRVRWQLEGWSALGHNRSASQGAVSLIRLEPVDIRPDKGRQVGFWGESDRHDEVVGNGFARIQGLFGPDSVKVVLPGGGRSPADAHRLALPGEEGPDVNATVRDGPWPGSLPAPAPAQLWRRPLPVEVVDRSGAPLGVSGRGVISAAPAFVSGAGGTRARVRAWAGPWCIEERWWDPVRHRRRARVQVLLEAPAAQARAADGQRRRDRDPSHPSLLVAHLLTLEGGKWWVEATYD